MTQPQRDAKAVALNADLEPRLRGRPRLAEVDDRILEATIDELCEGGVADLTFERVAARAGVARTTIYRRWPTKVDLMVGAIDFLRTRSVVPDTGDLRADLEAGLDNMLRMFTSPQGRAIAAVFSARVHNEELARAWNEHIGAPHVAAFRAVLEPAVESGRVRLAMGIDETISLLAGVAFVVLFGNMPASPGLAAGVVASVLDGIEVVEARSEFA